MLSTPIFWLTGNTGAGKSTLAFGVQKEWNSSYTSPQSSPSGRGSPFIIVLDGDEMRATISIEEDLSPEGRMRHNLRVARLAKLLSAQGFLVVVSVIAPFAETRKEIDAICSPRWIYVKREGLEAEDKPYEPPIQPEVVIDTDALSQEEAQQKLSAFVMNHL